MQGQTLATVLTLVKNELRASLSAGVADEAALKLEIETKQEWLASMYDWEQLADRWPVDVAALTRHTAVPTTNETGTANTYINTERPYYLYRKFNDTWEPMDYGIELCDYNSHRSLDGEGADPICKWAFKPGDNSSFEVWPLAETITRVCFVGQRRVKTLRTNNVLDTTKTVDLDSQLISLAVAVDRLEGKPGQKAKMALYDARFLLVRGGDKKSEERYFIGGQPKRFLRVKPGFKKVLVSG